MHVGTTFAGEFAHHGAMAKTARGGVRDQQFVLVDQGPCDRHVIRAPRPTWEGPCGVRYADLWAGRSVLFNRSADRLPLPALKAHRTGLLC